MMLHLLFVAAFFESLQSLRIDHRTSLSVLGAQQDALVNAFVEPEFDKLEESAAPKALRPLPGGFHYNHGHGASGVKYLDVQDFVRMLLTDLPENITNKLKQCGPVIKGNVDTTTERNQVWIILQAEGSNFEAEEVKAKHPTWFQDGHKVLILGTMPGIGGDSFVTKSVRHIYLPYASMEFALTRRFTPLDLVNRDHVESKVTGFLSLKNDQNIYAYQHKSCVPERERLFDLTCENLVERGLSCHALGLCNGKKGLANTEKAHNDRSRRDVNGRIMRTEDSIDKYSSFRFVEAIENTVGHPNGYGYVTEKILTPFLAGAIPVWGGPKKGNISEVFNPKAMLILDPDNVSVTTDRISYLMKHPKEYEAMVKEPAVTEEQMKKYFTWHPATFAKYGDGMRMKIINEILGLCALP